MSLDHALEDAARPLAALAASEGGIYACLDHDGLVLHVSDQTRELLGIADGTVVGASGFDTVLPLDLEDAMAAFLAAVEFPGIPQSVRVRARPETGPWRVLDLVVTGTADGVVVRGRDATEKRRAVVAGHLEESLLERVPVGLVVTDDAGIVVYWNSRATELFGRTPEEALGRSVHELAPNLLADTRSEITDAVRDAGRWEGEYESRRSDGTTLSVLVTLESFQAPEIGFSGVVMAALDNAERRALRDTLAHQALHDPLTGLPNRALFLDRLDHALARLHRVPGTAAVLFIDLDRFKIVNDTCGHHAGDEILRAVGALFESAVRPEDTVARLGGDEFAICCEFVDDPAAAMAVAERLTAAVSQPFLVSGREFFVTPSIGIVLGTGAPGETAATLLRDADAAMYCAKERGRARIEMFDHGMRLDVLRRAEVATELRHAIERKEFVLHYQPLVRTADGSLAGFEALLRWQHPTHGLLAPGEFIDVAEDTNLIVPIGAWVLGEAARQMAAWREVLPERQLPVSINLSARQIADPALVSIVRDALAANHLEGSRLCLEITESVLMGDAEASVATLRELKSLGVELAIDDFGTGYSSLTYLKRFPVDYLKIDRSFVHTVDREAEDAVIVRAVLELGRALGLAVVAEGVETDAQLAELQRLGCELAQGFRWSQPVGADEALALATDWHRHDTGEAPSKGGTTEEPALLSTSEVLSVLTHELATPLTVVKGQCERLAGLVEGLPRAADVVAAVARNAARIEQLVTTLTDAQQLDDGAIAVHPTPFDLVELVRDVIPLSVPGERTVVVEGDAVVQVEADGSRIEQILVNLLTNAHKFSPADTTVTVTVSADGDEVSVVVADEGPGVPPERVGDIFRKFARLERSKKGIGLGLFISRRLARAHGGDLHYRRRRPVGSELVLLLPRRTLSARGSMEA